MPSVPMPFYIIPPPVCCETPEGAFRNTITAKPCISSAAGGISSTAKRLDIINTNGVGCTPPPSSPPRAFHNAAAGGYHLREAQYHAAPPLSCAVRRYPPTRVSRKNNFGMLRVLPPHPLRVWRYALGASAAARLAYLVLFPRQVAKRHYVAKFLYSLGVIPTDFLKKRQKYA